MRQDEIGRIAEAVHDRLMNGPIKKLQESLNGIGDQLDRQDADIGGIKKGLEHISNALDDKGLI